jgi:hypothetical protein
MSDCIKFGTQKNTVGFLKTLSFRIMKKEYPKVI